MARALLLAPLPPRFLTSLDLDLEVVVPRDQAEAATLATDVDVCLAPWQDDGLVLDAEVAAALAPRCRLVQVPAAGLDGIDLEACHAHDLAVASAAGVNDVAVAEWVVWAVLDGLRGLVAAHAALADGRWRGHGRRGTELRGRRVGVVGMGDVGRALLPRLAAFDVVTSYWTRTRDPALEALHGVAWRELDDLVATSDVLVLAVASTPATRHLVDADRLAALPDGAVVVNVARGAVWDEAAVAAALDDDDAPLAAVATDVFTTEPPASGHPLLGRADATATPHVAGITDEVVARVRARVATNIAAALDEPPGPLAGRVR